jgi:hypothetical protein
MEEDMSDENPPQPPAGSGEDSQGPSLSKIQELLRTKNDTSRFVGLALLKSVLDNSKSLRDEDESLQLLWDCISPKFLDRLLRTGSSSSSATRNSKDMLDLAVSVLHTFTALLPEQARRDENLVRRIPRLASAVLHRQVFLPPTNYSTVILIVYSSEETTLLILQTLHTLVSYEEGAREFSNLEDTSALTEIAPRHKIVLDIYAFAWLNSMTLCENKDAFRSKVDKTIQSLVVSFTATDGVTLLEFLGFFLRNADPQVRYPVAYILQQ